MRKLGISPLAAVLSLAIVVALTAIITPQGCDAAGIVARSIYVNQRKPADFRSVQKAIDSIPWGNKQWIRIHVAAGVYFEKVNVPLNKSFILLEGEGKDQTFIEWGDHADGKTNTASSPTFASYATDFMARDITFKNTYYGVRDMAPAVAALVAGDRSSFHRCGFISVQDTLSDLAGRHYYHKCYIEGAMDFIFGNARSIFEECEVTTGKTPVSPGYITAQGRDSEKEDTGFVFKRCKLGGVTPTYLGRAWRAYARVIFYKTDMSSVVVSQGWDAWNYDGKESTLTMVESECTGQGSNRTGRMPWGKAVHPKQIARFLSLSYVSADGWLDAQPR
ncbi:hypothetical protein BRADI_2g11470v3 [Brachypodium distachyon]|uniref:pectinesterase n=2 Tax=Brachypodium distachyon TaxID=15368 RepID=I1HET6_BRADI|nr:hypothetical protein BRADI_2g11470v3 [Brachypodium distachyon]